MRPWIVAASVLWIACREAPVATTAPETDRCAASPDSDQDGVGDGCDVCPSVPDPLQRDDDFDGIGDGCEPLPAASCTAEGLCWEHPRPFGTRLSAAAVRGDEMWIAGLSLHHWDGQRWTVEDEPLANAPKQLLALPDTLWAIESYPLRLWRRDPGGHWAQVALPGSLEPERMWAADATRVWVEGGGTLVLTDGSTFQTVPPESWALTLETGRSLGAVAATSPSKVWSLTDKLRRFDGTRWVEVAPAPIAGGWSMSMIADGSGPIVPVYAGTLRLFRFGAQGWVEMPWPTGRSGALSGGPAGVWVVADRQAHRWTGAGWQQVGDPLPLRGRIVDVSGGDSGWLMSEEGGAWRWTGRAWSPLVELPPRPWAIASRGPDELWVVGDAGFTARRVAGRWQRIESGVDADLRFVASRGEELWAASEHGVVLHWESGAWKADRLPTSSVRGIWIGDTGVVVYGDETQRWTRATGLWEAARGWRGGLRMAGDSEEALYAVSNAGLDTNSVVLRRAGDRWEIDYETPEFLHDVDAAAGEVWAVGPRSVVRRDALGRWHEVAWREGGLLDWVRVRRPGEVYVGDEGGRLFRVDGDGFTFLRSGCRSFAVESLECLGDEGVVPVERGPAVHVPLAALGPQLVRFDGRQWQPIREGTDVWTDGIQALVLSDQGAVWRYEGGSWELRARLPDGSWNAIWSDGNVLFAAGQLSRGPMVVWREQDGAWKQVWRGTQWIFDLEGRGLDDLFASTAGALLRWDGERFVEEPVSAPPDVRWSVASTGRRGELWAVGGMQVQHRDGERWTAVAPPDDASHLSDVWSDGTRTWLLGMDHELHQTLWRREGDGWRRWSLPFSMPSWLGGTVPGEPRQVLLHTWQGLLRLPE